MPPPSAAVPGAPRLPASRAAAAALSAAPTPPAAPAPPHVALTPALLSPPAVGTDRPPALHAETNGRGVLRGQAHSAARGISRQVHWRGDLRGGAVVPPSQWRGWRGHPNSEEPTRQAASTEGGAQTPAGSGRGSEGPQGAEAPARAVPVSRIQGTRSFSDFCTKPVFRAKGLQEIPETPRGRGGR